MKQIVIKVLGFFIGFFITLFIISYTNIINKKIENFTIDVPTTENYSNSTHTTDEKKEDNDYSLIPYAMHKYMCINTFFDIKKISNSEGRWYECDLSVDKYNPENNQSNYFTYTKNINLNPNTINKNGSYGADINTIQLNGPKSFYFANNISTNELIEFSMVMTLKIIDIQEKNNILFELTGNTETVDAATQKYTFSIININIVVNDKGNYDFIIIIGNTEYKGNINNIDKNLIKNNDFIVIGFIYTQKEITFLINKQMYKYTTNDKFQIKLSSTPVIINKNGSINMELYNFIYYKTVLPIDEYLNCFKHNYHYLSGLHTLIEKKQETITEYDKTALLTDKLNNFEEKLGSYFKRLSETTKDTPIEPIQPFNINSLNTTKNNSSSFFSFLF